MDEKQAKAEAAYDRGVTIKRSLKVLGAVVVIAVAIAAYYYWR